MRRDTTLGLGIAFLFNSGLSLRLSVGFGLELNDCIRGRGGVLAGLGLVRVRVRDIIGLVLGIDVLWLGLGLDLHFRVRVRVR